MQAAPQDLRLILRQKRSQAEDRPSVDQFHREQGESHSYDDDHSTLEDGECSQDYRNQFFHEEGQTRGSDPGLHTHRNGWDDRSRGGIPSRQSLHDSENKMLRYEKVTLRDALEAANQQLVNQNHRINELVSKEEQLKRDVDFAQGRLSNRDEEITGLRQIRGNLIKDLHAAEEKIFQLNKKLQDHTAPDKDHVHKRVASVDIKVHEQEREIQALRRDKDSLRRELENLRRGGGTTRHVSEDADLLYRKNEHLREMLDAADRAASDEKRRAANTVDKIKSLERKLHENQARLDEEVRARHEVKTKLAEVQQTVNTLTATRESLFNERTGLYTSLEAAGKEKHELCNKLDAASRDAFDKNEEIVSLRWQAHDQGSQIAALNALIEESNAKLKAAREDLQATDSQTVEIKALKHSKEILKASVSNLVQDIQKKSAEIQRLRREKELADATCAELRLASHATYMPEPGRCSNCNKTNSRETISREIASTIPQTPANFTAVPDRVDSGAGTHKERSKAAGTGMARACARDYAITTAQSPRDTATAELTQRLEAANQKLKALEQDARKSKTKNEMLSTRLEACQDKVSERNEQVQRLKANLEASDRRADAAERDVCDYKIASKRSLGKIRELEDQLENACAYKHKYRDAMDQLRELQDRQTETDRLKRDLDRSKNKTRVLDEEVKKLEKKCDLEREKRGGLEKRCQILEQRAKAVSDRLASKREEVIKLGLKLEDTDDKYHTCKGHLDTQDVQMTDMTDKLWESESKRNDLSVRLQESEAKNEDLCARLDQARSREKEHGRNLSDKEHELRILHKQHEAVKTRLTASNAKIQRLEAVCSSLQTSSSVLQNTAALHRVQKDALQRFQTSFQGHVAQLDAFVNGVEKAFENVAERLTIRYDSVIMNALLRHAQSTNDRNGNLTRELDSQFQKYMCLYEEYEEVYAGAEAQIKALNDELRLKNKQGLDVLAALGDVIQAVNGAKAGKKGGNQTCAKINFAKSVYVSASCFG
jgi:chromosome segregation ATPase